MKTKKDILEKINEIEDKLFRHSMIDIWDNEDYKYSNELHQNKLKLENELKNIDNLTFEEKINIVIEKLKKQKEYYKLNTNSYEVEKVDFKIDILEELKKEWN